MMVSTRYLSIVHLFFKTIVLDHGESLLGFNSTIFFIGFLPPIIFNSGYQINRRLFFKNMGGILALAVVGTGMSSNSKFTLSKYHLDFPLHL